MSKFNFLLRGILLLLILWVTPCNSKRTLYYSQFNGSNSHLFYNNNTFGVDLSRLFGDPCLIISNAEYRRMLNKFIPCTETLCLNGTFNCPKSVISNCYHVEHIYDTRDNNLSDIVVNRVMAWGKWNMALGRLSYNDSLQEKTEIYGSELMEQVYIQLLKCQQKSSRNNTFGYTIILVSVILGIALVLLICIAISIRKKNHEFKGFQTVIQVPWIVNIRCRLDIWYEVSAFFWITAAWILFSIPEGMDHHIQTLSRMHSKFTPTS